MRECRSTASAMLQGRHGSARRTAFFRTAPSINSLGDTGSSPSGRSIQSSSVPPASLTETTRLRSRRRSTSPSMAAPAAMSEAGPSAIQHRSCFQPGIASPTRFIWATGRTSRTFACVERATSSIPVFSPTSTTGRRSTSRAGGRWRSTEFPSSAGTRPGCAGSTRRFPARAANSSATISVRISVRQAFRGTPLMPASPSMHIQAKGSRRSGSPPSREPLRALYLSARMVFPPTRLSFSLGWAG